MKNKFFISALFMFTMCFASNHSYAQEDWTGNVNILLGQKSLNSDDWSYEDFYDLSKQNEIGFNIDFGPKSWPICFVTGYLKSKSEDTYSEEWYGTETFEDEMYYYDVTDYYTDKLRTEGSTSELKFGIKKIWEPTSTMRPYVSGGLTMIRAKLKLIENLDLETYPEFNQRYSDSDSDNAFGMWVAGGIYWTIARQLNLGFEIGYSKAKVTIFDEDTKAGGTHGLFLVGYHW